MVYALPKASARRVGSGLPLGSVMRLAVPCSRREDLPAWQTICTRDRRAATTDELGVRSQESGAGSWESGAGTPSSRLRGAILAVPALQNPDKTIRGSAGSSIGEPQNGLNGS